MANPEKSKQPFDLKDIDADLLSRALSEHQNTVIKSVLIVGSLVWVVMMFSNYKHKEWDLRYQLSKAQEKLEVLKSRQSAIQALNDFKSSLPKKINEFELITLISNDAKLYNVTIASLSPAESLDMGLYDIINVSFNSVSDNFKDMMLFLRRIEKSSFPIRINSWSGHEQENGTIIFTIEISAVIIHP